MPRAGGTPEPLGLDLPPRSELNSRCSHRSDTPRSRRAQTPSYPDESCGSASCRARHGDGGTLVLHVSSGTSGPQLSLEMNVDVPRDPREAGRSAKLFRKMLRVVAGLYGPQTSRQQRKWFIQGARAAQTTLRRFDKLGFIGNFENDYHFEDKPSLCTWYLSIVDSMRVLEVDCSFDHLVVQPPPSAPTPANVWPGRKVCHKYRFGENCDMSDDELLLGVQAPITDRSISERSQTMQRTLPDDNQRLSLPEPMIQDLIRSLQTLNLEPDKTVFQFDCGEGDLLRTLCQEVGCSGVGVDRHVADVKEAQRRAEESNVDNVKFRRAALRDRHDLSNCGAVLAFLPREQLWYLAEYTLPKAKLKKDTPVFVFDWACGDRYGRGHVDLLGLPHSTATRLASGLAILLHTGGRAIRPPVPDPKPLKCIIEPITADRRHKAKPRPGHLTVAKVADQAYRKAKSEQT
eukprot:gnl/MRDRNA2_/MRDRNA2_27199_c0_seq1.p1 gnl/MRDRNA2_/MRDRNA2_27199_c0~~gnl/MRDRNA2_/MRDRNA2_27199_c0_seq1.p1  ORF type:complete len:460 (+),score=49.00 gnl/MRDRNA2_/MRDRNA2_27199_c0_seq1:104-1483(+)